ncbi:MAG TPA: hypothetical protein VN833_07030 [Candidatus Acidoferrales bacterium]|nr:hypothetical protein [Candidatus Acidoferrales bacterium]
MYREFLIKKPDELGDQAQMALVRSEEGKLQRNFRQGERAEPINPQSPLAETLISKTNSHDRWHDEYPLYRFAFMDEPSTAELSISGKKLASMAKDCTGISFEEPQLYNPAYFSVANVTLVEATKS